MNIIDVSPPLINGVSQQSPATRREGTAEEQINFLGTLVDGLKLRPGLRRVYQCAYRSGGWANETVEMWLYKQDGEDYLIISQLDVNEPLVVIKLSTFDKLYVSYQSDAYGSAQDYLNIGPYQGRRAAVVGDKLLIVNRAVVPAVTEVGSSSTPQGTVQTFSQLPSNPQQGHWWIVQGNDVTGFNKYYVKWTGSVWVECANESQLAQFIDKWTMPVQLSIAGTSAIVDAVSPWENRKVGDRTTNPNPSFIGKPIRDICYFRGRLGIITASNVVFSQVGKFTNFYATSTLSVLDDDPIDIALSLDSSDELEWYAIFDKELLVSGRKSQISVGSGESPILSPKTITATPVTRFEIAPRSAPLSAGPNVYFLTAGDKYLGVREYYIQSQTLLQDAADITAAVPRYIEAIPSVGSVAAEPRITGVNIDDILIVRPHAMSDKLYVYKYFWGGEEKIQSAWSRWAIPTGHINGICAIDRRIYIVVCTGDNRVLAYFDMEDPPDFGGISFPGDYKHTITATYNAGTGRTTFACASVFTVVKGNRPIAFYKSDGSLLYASNMTHEGGVTYSIAGNYAGQWTACCAIPQASYTFSEYFPRDNNGLPISARCQLRTLELEINNTAGFTVEVAAQGRDTREVSLVEYTSNMEIIGSYDTMPLLTGKARIPIYLNSREAKITLKSQPFLPVNVVSAGFNLLITQRGRNV